MESIFGKVAGPSCFFILDFEFLQNQQAELFYEKGYSKKFRKIHKKTL